MNDYVKKAESLGYRLGVAFEAYKDEGYDHEDGTKVESQSSPAVYRVEGFGVSTLIAEDNTEEWERLLDHDAHTFRVDMFRHDNPDDDFELDRRSIVERSTALAVKFGHMEPKERQEELKRVSEEEKV